MKAQTKALVASVVVIALALSAVSGITYSWFSDTEQSKVDITTAVVDLEPRYTVNGTSSIGTTLTKGEASNGVQSFTLNNLAANQQFTIISEIQNKSTVKTVYRMYATWEEASGASITGYDIQNVSINGTYLTTTPGTSDEPSAIIANWTTLEVGNSPSPSTITIATPTTYGDYKSNTGGTPSAGYVLPDGSLYSEDWDAQTTRSGLTINIVIEAYQGDYPTTAMTMSEDNKTATAELTGNKVVTAKKIVSSETSSSQQVEDVVVNFSNVSTYQASGTGAQTDVGSGKIEMQVSKIEDTTTTVKLTLKDSQNQEISSPTFDKPVVITMTVPGAISDPRVVYNGTGADATVLSSTIVDEKTTIVFSVTHFSEYVIKQNGDPETQYELQKALAAGGNVKLGASFNLTQALTIEKDVVLDLNGQKITFTSEDSGADNYSIKVSEGASLTVTGSTGSEMIFSNNTWGFKVWGKLTINGDATFTNEKNVPTDGSVVVGNKEDGSITINGGTFIAESTWGVAVQATHGSIDIYGGTFKGTPKDNKAGWLLNQYNSDPGRITVYGGSFYNRSPADGDDTSSGSAYDTSKTFVADGYAVSSTISGDDTIYTVVPAVAQIGDVYYATLESAFDAAQGSSDATSENPVVIEVLRDSSGNGIAVASGSNITADFNGFTYTISGTLVGSNGSETNGFQLLEDSTITFKNGKISMGSTAGGSSGDAKRCMVVQNYSNLTLDGMTIDGTNLYHPTVRTLYVLSNNNGTTKIINTKIISNAGHIAFDVYGAFENYSGPSVTVSGNSDIGGTIEVDISGGAGTYQSLTIEDGVNFRAMNVKNVLSGASLKIASGVYSEEKVTVPSGYQFSLDGGYYVLETASA